MAGNRADAEMGGSEAAAFPLAAGGVDPSIHPRLASIERKMDGLFTAVGRVLDILEGPNAPVNTPPAPSVDTPPAPPAGPPVAVKDELGFEPADHAAEPVPAGSEPTTPQD